MSYDHEHTQVRALFDFLKDNYYDDDIILKALEEYGTYTVFKNSQRVLFFSQGIWWKDQDNRMLRISEMDIGHAHNLTGWLKRNYHKYLQSLYNALMYRSSEVPEEVVRSIEEELDNPDVTSTPLYQAVKARADQEGVDFWNIESEVQAMRMHPSYRDEDLAEIVELPTHKGQDSE